jgi:hypothetical protein
MTHWLNKKATQEFIHEVKKRFNVSPVRRGRGRVQKTWIHPLLFIDMALAMSPSLKIEVYDWLFDHLIRKRNDSGDSYRRMCGDLYTRFPSNKDFPRFIRKVATAIQERCGVEDDDWQGATEEQLARRDKIHENISLLLDVMPNYRQAIRIALDRG